MEVMKINNKKRYMISIILSFVFIFSSVISIDMRNTFNVDLSHKVYAKGGGKSTGGFKSSGFSSSTKSSSGSSSGSKSGSFSSPNTSNKKPSSSSSSPNSSGSSTSKSSSGDYKSGSFSNSKKSAGDNQYKPYTGPGGNSTQQQYNSSTKRSFFPMFIPIPWGSSHGGYAGSPGYGSPSLLGSLFGGIFQIIILIIIVVVIIKIIKKIKRKR